MKLNLSHRKILLVILAISVALRIGAAFYLGNTVEVLPGTFDQVSYHNLAQRILGGFGFTFDTFWWPATPAGEQTAHWSFLYTFYLTAVYFLFGPNPLVARLLQALIVGLLHPLLAYKLGEKIFNPNVGLVSAGITAVYIYFIYYSATLMTEPFYISAILASLLLAVLLAQSPGKNRRRDWLLGTLLGLSLGAAILLRQLFMLVAPFLLLWVAYSRWRNMGKISIRTTLVSLVVPALVIVVMILPFTFFNSQRFDTTVLLNTNAGYAFFWGNHPIHGTNFYDILPPDLPSYQQLIPRELRSLDEAALDQALLREGLRFVLDDPVRYLLLSINRVKDYFVFWPSAGSGVISNLSRVFSFGIFLPFMIYGILLALFNRKWAPPPRLSSPIVLLLLYALLYTVIHLLTWTLIRYRLPVDAVLIIFAGLAIVDLASRVSAVRRDRTQQPAAADRQPQSL